MHQAETLMGEEQEPRERVATSLRMLKIIELMASAGRPLSLAEISSSIGLPKSSVHRLCGTLMDNGYAIRSSDERRLTPSPKLTEIASKLVAKSYQHIALHQIMKQLSLDVGETVNLVVPEKQGMTYLERVETNWPLRIQLPIGTHVPFHCTASGKVFLASIPQNHRRTMAESLQLDQFTSRTIGKQPVLMDELEKIERQGFALDQGEFIDGMVAIAVPVQNGEGHYIASLALHGPSQRLSIDALVSQKGALLEAAEKIAGVWLT